VLLLLAYFVFVVVALAVVMTALAVVLGRAPKPDDVPFPLLLLSDGVGKACAVGAVLLLLAWRRESGLLPRPARPSPRAMAAGALTALAFLPVMVAAGLAQNWVYERLHREPQTQDLVVKALDGSDLQFAMVAVFAVTVAPLFEEWAFRGLLQPGLRARWGRLPAIVISAAAFAAIHFEVDSLPSLFLLGLFLGDLRERTGGLTAPIVMHACYNAYQMAAILVMRGAA
jgi:hypothetical protein